MKRLLSQRESGCPKRPRSNFIPTRLIDQGSRPCDTPRLIITAASLTSPVKYAALSYCWGNRAEAATQLKTEHKSLADRHRGIPVSLMAKVMQDAVLVCHSLSIQYLWIDALCIIQDTIGSRHDSDWDIESEMMGLIFLNAHVTICAASAASCHESFLNRTKKPRVDIGYASTLHSQAFGTFTLLDPVGADAMYQQDSPQSDGGDDPLYRDLWRCKWRTRGWVFQEQYMSTRHLIFGRSMMHFKCAWLSISENGYAHRWREPQLFSEKIRLATEGTTNGAFNYRDHRSLIQEYARTHLSFETDRLPAFAGIARAISGSSKDKYLAGMWRRELKNSLLWYAYDSDYTTVDDVIAARLPQSVAAGPSWSWVSTGGGGRFRNLDFVSREDIHLRPEYQQLLAWTTFAGSNPHGNVTIGVLRITAQLFPLGSVTTVKLFVHEIMAGMTYDHWRVYVGDDYVATCYSDWKVTKTKALY